MEKQITMRTFSILLADDDDDDRNFFKEALEKLDIKFRLTEFPDCKELATLVDNKNFDIIFLDLNMPYISGLECLQLIRQNKKLDSIPIVIYSTSKHTHDIESTYRAGANMYFVKPYEFAEIVNSLKNIFSTDLRNYLKRTKDKFVLS